MKKLSLKILSLLCLLFVFTACNNNDDGDVVADDPKNSELSYENISQVLNGSYKVLKIETSSAIDFWDNGNKSTQSQDVKDVCRRKYGYTFKENKEFATVIPNCNNVDEYKIGRGTYEIKGKTTIVATYVLDEDDTKTKYTKTFENVKITIKNEKGYRKYYVTFDTSDVRFSTILHYTLQDNQSIQQTAWVD